MRAWTWLWVMGWTLLATVGTAGAAEPNWVEVESMQVSRFGHSATLLQDGRILVAGGQNNGHLVNAEIFDPDTGKWVITGSMHEGRSEHTATLLPSGQVLVVGGHGLGRIPLGSAELYDPLHGTWRSVTPISPRVEHTATLLPSGHVMIAGGTESDDGPFINTVQIYNPDEEDDPWYEVGSLNQARVNHSATVLNDGDVLIVGGSFTGRLDCVERYDASDKTWTRYERVLVEAQDQHTATMLPSGHLLIAGGLVTGDAGIAEILDPMVPQSRRIDDLPTSRPGAISALLPSGHVMLVGGGHSPSSPTAASADLFDPDTETWSTDFALRGARILHTVTVLPTGDLLAAGGRVQNIDTSTAELFPSGELFGSWTPADSLNIARASHTASLLPNGKILVAGGRDGDLSLGSVEIYDPTTMEEEWTLHEDALTTPRFQHTATLLQSGDLLIAGGLGEGGVLDAQIYHPDTGDWSPAGTTKERREATATLLPSGRVVLVGGMGAMPGDVRDLVEIFDPLVSPPQWTDGAPLQQARSQHTATLLRNGKILVVGGSGGSSPLSSAEIYDPDTDSWSNAGQTSGTFLRHAATLLPSGEVLVVGGSHQADVLRAEIYDPITNQWRSGSRGPFPVFDNSLVLLPTGKALLAGGETIDGATRATEIFDPLSQTWTSSEPMQDPRSYHGLTVMASGRVLAVGGSRNAPGVTAEIYSASRAEVRKPIIQSVQSEDLPPRTIGFGSRFEITGQFRAHADVTNQRASSPSIHPLFLLRQVNGPKQIRLTPDPRPEGSNYWDEPTTYSFSHLPPYLNAGHYNLFVTVAGIASHGFPVEVTCGHQLIQSVEVTPQGDIPVGENLTFQATTQGVRRFQWQRNGFDIPGANEATYVTPAVSEGDDGDEYRLQVRSGCANKTSASTTLQVQDSIAPEVELIYPTGGERWPFSTSSHEDDISKEVIRWTMSDNLRVCQVDIELLYSVDGGANYLEAPAGGGLPATLGVGEGCTPEQQVDQTSLEYTLPESFPGVDNDALYKIRIRALDKSGNQAIHESPNPFFIVDPNTEYKTLILKFTDRMREQLGGSLENLATFEEDLMEVEFQLESLANHNRVQGLIVDLKELQQLAPFFEAWDQAGSKEESVQRANQILFGCPETTPADCPTTPSGQPIHSQGIHGTVRNLKRIFPSLRNLVLVGDDRIIPMARLADGATLLPESRYTDPALGDLTEATPVGKALAADRILSDDPLANLDITSPEDLNHSLFIPDLAVGRLVEDPSEILTTLQVFLGRDGVLDLSDLHPETGHKVQCTGYDFLTDVANKINNRWHKVFDAPIDGSLSPVDGALIGQGWGEAQLEGHLCGNTDPARPYGILSLNGHATHYEEGIPGDGPFDIQGLSTDRILDSTLCAPGVPLDLSGSVIYSIGCHAGLTVAGNDANDADHSQDLTQSFLSRGAVVYIGNTGYGWGLLHGVGYSERLVEIFTEYLSAAGSGLEIGTAVLHAKRDYGQGILDAYDAKTSMQWTVFGLPMYSVRLNNRPNLVVPDEAAAPPSIQDKPLEEVSPSGIHIQRHFSGHGTTSKNDSLPSFVTSENSNFNLSAPGVYRKFDALGQDVDIDTVCPTPDEGCYYALNGQYDYATGMVDLPIEPFFLQDSRLHGTSQHGTLWLGGSYQEETPWHPMFATLVSNGATSSGLGSLPRKVRILPTASQSTPGLDPENCRHSDRELNSLMFPVGELVCGTADCQTDRTHRRFEQFRVETFYYNNTVDQDGNCDRTGPELSPGFEGDAYHQVEGTTLRWAVEATDDEADTWRVIVVYDLGQGVWEPLELTNDAGIWSGNLNLPSGGDLTYVLQAVDTRGNVTWLEWQPADGSSTPGAEPHLANTVEVSIDAREADLAIDLTNGGDRFDASTDLVYTLTLTNHGPEAVQGAGVQVALPDMFVLAQPADGLWTNLSLEPGESQFLTLTATLASNAQGNLSVTANVLLPEGFIDPDTSNNSATDIDLVEIGPPALQVTQTAAPTQLTWPGGEVEMTVTVTNTSDVNDPVDLLSLIDDVHGDLDGQGSCDPPVVIVPDGDYSCAYTVWIEGDAGSVNTSTVTAHGTDDEGVDAQGSGATNVQIVAAQADLDIAKTDERDIASPGDITAYLITVTNHGPDAVSGVDVIDALPSALESPFPPDGQWLDLSLNAGESVTLQLTGTIAIDANGTLINTAEVVLPAGVVDPDLSNNIATDQTPLEDGLPSITVDLVAAPTEVQTPEGEVTFTLTITNTSEPSDVVTLHSLEDDLQGDLDGAGECVLPVHIAPGDSYICSYGTSISGSAGDEVTVTVTAQGVDEENDPAEGSASATVQIIDTLGPQLVDVSSVSDTGDGRLEAKEVTQATLTQIHLHFSEALDLDSAQDTAGYRLIEAGADRILQTEDCAGLQDDDEAYAVDVALALTDETVALWVHSGAALPQGLYRLWACDTVTDVHGNGLTQASLDFSVTAEHQLQASNFDDAAHLDTWLVLADPPATVTFSDDDVGQATTSGSAQLSSPGGTADVAISQCIQVGWPYVLELGGQTKVNATDPDTPALFAAVDLFSSTDCNEGAMGGSSLPLHVGSSVEDWLALASGKVVLPTDTLSVLVTFSAQGSGEAFEVWLDDLYVKLAPLHGDGFESGDTSRWSVAVP